ncbi:MAG TPA: hypothetical protein VIJ94_03945 [Caulobacteraceae bacterium]
MSTSATIAGGVSALILLGLCACGPGGTTSVPVEASSAPPLSGASAASSAPQAQQATPASSAPASSGYDRWPQRRHAHSSTDGERG